ncbi:asparagine--tRNA ligase [candidate division WOR-3 bacterium JGI_Cruoil_03_44_89]|uniref:Asparagine--tRNA ligase n=1 Tax=candidate division WOR-3 bacterium JGI_Cruoil_03_44_89 TaxID=1973748 RepID=A0A235BSJ9_UNCW3|nr:MAG: asparagine--tRNA ligase [candidate division WOR-3 bacterium JGI_Cruoil_03_44_89]
MCYIEELHRHNGDEVTIKGWVYNRRSSGKIVFLLIRDGSGIAQVVVLRSEVSGDVFNLCDTIPYESSVIVIGTVHKDERAPGGYELLFKNIDVVSSAENYPISLKEHGIDFLLERRHLWLRSRRPFAVMRIRSTCIKAICDFFDSRGFVRLDAPLLTPSACEGTTTLFEVPYFNTSAYLSQSGQLYMEAGCMAFGRVYCFGPSFRAEKSKTRRHLTEFWQVEPEIAYATLGDVMQLAEELVEYIVGSVLDKNSRELEMLGRDITPLTKIKSPFERITYTEAANLVGMDWGGDFGAPEETKLSNKFKKPIHVTGYPHEVKAFYMKRDPRDDRIALNFDTLAPEGCGEIIGGGQREDELAKLEERIREYDLPRKDYEWYLDLRRYGTCPHAGFGLGLERTVTWICGIHHVRESIPFPRTIDRIYP